MRVAIYSARAFERPFLERANAGRHELLFCEAALGPDTAPLAQRAAAVSVFVADEVSAARLEELAGYGVRYLAVRGAGSDNVDLAAARRLGVRVATVPDYSPHAIAEHTVLLVLALARHLRRADEQLRANDFRLDRLIGFDLHGKTVGIVGVGRIGEVVAGILHGFGCRLLGTDPQPDPALTQRLGLRYVPLPELCAQADIITLHAPLTPATHHLIDAALLAQMKRGVLLVNTGRGGVLDTEAALQALESGQLGYLGLDVYEGEKGLFFQDHSRTAPHDATFARLLTQPNVLVTGHQAYLTHEALTNIADATIASLDAWELEMTALILHL